MASVDLTAKFQGCLVGSHVGDCFGEPFEGDCLGSPFDKDWSGWSGSSSGRDIPVSKSALCNYISHWLSDPDQKKLGQPYTDDTAMTLCVANSLIANKGFNAKDMGRRFVEEYKRDPVRNYGGHIHDVFVGLEKTDYSDVFVPAKKQFNGSGSYGNGAAMRIAPVALYGYAKEGEMVQLAKDSSRITHAHHNGYNGAILQCLAVHLALKTDSTTEINPLSFIDILLEKMEQIEKPEDASSSEKNQPYCTSLKKMKELFEKSKNLSPEEVCAVFGNSVVAHRSVPTAIYSFLKSLKPSQDVNYENPFVRAMYHAVSVGGDTDTIGAMAGSISGAYHGVDVIPKNFWVRCEAIEKSKQAAEKMLELFVSA